MRLFERIFESKLWRKRAQQTCTLAVAWAISSVSSQAAIAEAWVQRYNDPANSNDLAEAVAVDKNGNVIVTGTSHNAVNADYYTTKYAAGGDLLWEQRYNGPTNGSDHAYCLALDDSGNVLVAGSSQDQFHLVKYAAPDGALLWEQRRTNGYGRGVAIGADESGNVIVTGVFTDGTSGDYYTAKYASSNGTLLWEQRYNGPANRSDEPRALALERNGNAVVTGTSHDSPSNTAYYTAKYAATSGLLLWDRRYDGSTENYAQGVAVDDAGDVVVTGISISGGNTDWYTIKYAATNGGTLWEKRYNGPGNGDDDARTVVIDHNRDVIVTGYSFGTNGNFDAYTVKYSGTDGRVLWDKRYNGPGNDADLANAVAVDSVGNVVVAGVSSDRFRNHDYYTAKYATADGALLWEQRYNGPSNGADLVASSHGLSLGAHGIVAITGYSDGDFGPET
ncbi:MAG TPA: PQQ-binding-like beta-propeller repeat protein, partial [Blastocatellia bacterium]|nr:PQQ-binding-like beta-propeller repeat protein [Blastocatellia bacterium]